MSDEQQQAAIGRTVEAYLASKKKLAALQSEAIKIGGAVSQTGQNINSLGAPLAMVPMEQVVGIINRDTATFPSGESLRALVQDIRTEFERKHTLSMQLKNMGLEQKD
jgi:hypothetical protein